MQYVMLIYQGATPLPDSEEWAALSEEEQKQIYADYGAINKTPGNGPPPASGTTRAPDFGFTPMAGRVCGLSLNP